MAVLRGTGKQGGDAAGAGTRLADRPCQAVVFKAMPTNVGKVYLGDSTVTVASAAGSTDITTGIVLSAGEWSPMMPANNLNEWYVRSDNANDDVTYAIFG